MVKFFGKCFSDVMCVLDKSKTSNLDNLDNLDSVSGKLVKFVLATLK